MEGVDRVSANLVRLCDALKHRHDKNPKVAAVTEASRSLVYETVLGSIDTNFQAKIFHDPALRTDWLVLTVDECGTLINSDLNRWYDSQSLYFDWRYKEDDLWYQACELPGQGKQFFPRMNFGNTAIRMKVEDFLTVVEQNTCPVASILHSVIHAYNPPLDLNTVTQMIKDGPTEELRRIGLPKYLGDVLIDGSQSKIRIV
jgi:hypothetical protein